MIEKKIISLKKNELAIKEFIKKNLGKGKISEIKIARTPIGEKIVIITARPGVIVGRRGENILDLTESLKREFGLQNPKLEIAEIKKPEFDAQTIADQIALALERFGSNSFKIVAYRFLERVKRAGALGCEIILGGRLPSEKARSWRFAFGYLKKTGETSNLVDRAEAVGKTKSGVVGVKVAVLPPDVKIPDRIEIRGEE